MLLPAQFILYVYLFYFIFNIEGFVFFCSCLFLVGVMSELISFVKLCFSKLLVTDETIVTAKSSKINNESNDKKLPSSGLLIDTKNFSPFYNSFEMKSPVSSLNFVSSSKSLVSTVESVSIQENSTSVETNNAKTSVIANYGTHFDLIKFHPADLISDLKLIQKLNTIERKNLTKY